MNDKIGELMARFRYWRKRAAHHTSRGAALRCIARADLLKQAIREELGYALGRVSASPRGLEAGGAELRAYWDEIDVTGGEVQLDLPLRRM